MVAITFTINMPNIELIKQNIKLESYDTLTKESISKNVPYMIIVLERLHFAVFNIVAIKEIL